MSRRARLVVPGLPHHITQRGNRRGDIFHEPEDRLLYMELLREYFDWYRLRLWAYDLMTNHVHLIAVPETALALSKALRDTHAAYAAEFNRKYGLTGHLWQARFYSCVLDDAHLWHAVRYVERNPVRAGMVSSAEDYAWSSAFAHAHGEQDRYLDDGLPMVGVVQDWSAWLAESDGAESTMAIRQATSTGRVCGSDDFIDRLESQYGHPLRPQKRGRKPHSTVVSDIEESSAPFEW